MIQDARLDKKEVRCELIVVNYKLSEIDGFS